MKINRTYTIDADVVYDLRKVPNKSQLIEVLLKRHFKYPGFIVKEEEDDDEDNEDDEGDQEEAEEIPIPA